MQHRLKRDNESMLEFLKEGFDEELSKLKSLPRNKLSDSCKKILVGHRNLWKNGVFQEDQCEAIEKEYNTEFYETVTEYEEALIDLFCIRMNYLDEKAAIINGV